MTPTKRKTRRYMKSKPFPKIIKNIDTKIVELAKRNKNEYIFLYPTCPYFELFETDKYPYQNIINHYREKGFDVELDGKIIKISW